MPGVTVNLATGIVQGGHAEGDTLNSIERITGSVHADQLTGSTGANSIDGGDGNVLYGHSGADSLDGGEDNDRLDGGEGADTLWGGDDADTFVFGDGDTVADFKTAATRSTSPPLAKSISQQTLRYGRAATTSKSRLAMTCSR